MPPPSWTGRSSPTALTIVADHAPRSSGLPANAPFRSTTCRRRAPCASQCFAIATGSSENTVASLHVALLQAHAVAVLEIDRGNDEHRGCGGGKRGWQYGDRRARAVEDSAA